ncbi:LuxR C-terminal-related transcriptional regulator [Murimonas intestini]|uniref:Regulatory LuxR family protein n=2 Tax=Murimonas intestini TaxID=1337051 RepID=A0AB73T2J5_9FIRM|nr:LuxR C-terminal-related transcriptional regulator [Murimonas intestini]MCR1867288.1 LuxR C-terminal-related transcriptional regulator [Murimonas intestini]MCR1884474.1 LuxR C-terminal-related transcriptional regulator [Murimonas intestini]
MAVLKETEWSTINRVLLELYEIRELNQLTEKMLKVFRMLIPYSQGYFLIYDPEGEIDLTYSSFLEMDERTFNTYTEMYYEKDYLRLVFELSDGTITYRDTDIMEESIRKKTEFYREFLWPNNIPYGLGIVLRREGRLLGIINLFRSGELGDFSDKDLYILEVIKDHLANRVAGLEEPACERSGQRTIETLERAACIYGFSQREKEVVDCLVKGCSNALIGEELSISESTVKKHIYNVYLKTDVNTRTQLRALLDKV